jgi:hypothetical protein
MVLNEVVAETLASIADLATQRGLPIESIQITAPSLELEVLRVFVSFPIVFAAEGFIASQECTAVWPLMSLHVLSVNGDD